MKNLRYLFLVCLTWMILGSCGEEYVYNTRVVTGVDLLDVGEEVREEKMGKLKLE